MAILTSRHDAVHALGCFLDRHPVLLHLREADAPEDCADAAHQLGTLADTLGFNGRTPSLTEELAAISAACRRFTTVGRYGQAYADDPALLMAQRAQLKRALETVLTGAAAAAAPEDDAGGPPS